MAMDVRVVTADLVKVLASRPELLYALAPRQFEEVIAELLGRRGYDITLTPASKDGGVDIFAAKREALGTFLYVVECKRYSPHKRVGVGLIRNLVGAIAQHHATAGMLATTSFFTAGARALEQQFSWQVSLKDYADVSAWLDARGPIPRSDRAAA
jgi:restriction system protein